MKTKKRMNILTGKLRAKMIISLFAIITLSACGDDDDGYVTPDTDINASSNVRIIEVDALLNEVTLQNFGDGEANLTEYWFCLRRSYVQLNEVTINDGDLTLAQNETVTFSIEVNDEGSDVSVYNTGGAFTSADALVDFMQFNGSYTTNGREDVAVAKGIWTAGEFVVGESTFEYTGDGDEIGLSFWE